MPKQPHHQGEGDKKPEGHEIDGVENHQEQPYEPIAEYQPHEGSEE